MKCNRVLAVQFDSDSLRLSMAGTGLYVHAHSFYTSVEYYNYDYKTWFKETILMGHKQTVIEHMQQGPVSISQPYTMEVEFQMWNWSWSNGVLHFYRTSK